MEIVIILHDGSIVFGHVEDYTPESFGKLINENHNEMLIFGDGGIVKHAIKRYLPVDKYTLEKERI